ncbi:MAG: M48 family metalloprotease [Gemmatimonadaceae bacterium]|nr:M48 family metalloprotease [Gemmatimonadaceae bacterium]
MPIIRRHRPRGLRAALALLALSGAALAGLAACAVNPATGKRELSLVSESQEIQMGLDGAKAAAAQMGIYPDSNVQRYVNSLGQQVAKNGERPGLPWSFTVVDDPIVNAFALPGGPIFVSRGILTHMNSEAQLVSVLGHEVGHVTAKHSVSQLSKQQLLGGLFTVGMIVRPELQQFSGIASQGLGLLSLKYGRDDETQADGLGFRYMTRLGYDPHEMGEMFKTLERVSGGGNRGTPEWLSTHPDPGNRVARTAERIAEAGPTVAAAKRIERNVFLRTLDGMVFGDDPRQGYFNAGAFLHPTLKFRFTLPSGWKAQNTASAVITASAQGDAQIVLELSENAAPQTLLSQFLGQQGVKAGATSTSAINGLPAAVGQFSGQTEDGTVLAGYVAFIQLDGNTYRFLAITPQQTFGTYDGAFRGTIGSFARLTDPAALAAKPMRVRLVSLPRAMTLNDFNTQYPSAVPVATIALINGVDATASIPSGTLVKRVVVE